MRVPQIFQRRAFQKLSNKPEQPERLRHESIAGGEDHADLRTGAGQFRTFQQDRCVPRGCTPCTSQFLMWPGVQTISVMTISFISFVGVMGFGGVNVTTGVLIAFVISPRTTRSGDQHRQLL